MTTSKDLLLTLHSEKTAVAVRACIRCHVAKKNANIIKNKNIREKDERISIEVWLQP